MKFHQRFKNRITPISKRGLKYLFEQSIKKNKDKKQIDLNINEDNYHKNLSRLYLQKSQISLTNNKQINCPHCLHQLPQQTIQNVIKIKSRKVSRLKTSYSLNIQNKFQKLNPNYNYRTNSSYDKYNRYQQNPQFLSNMLQKHKNLISMLDKRSKYSTFIK